MNALRGVGSDRSEHGQAHPRRRHTDLPCVGDIRTLGGNRHRCEDDHKDSLSSEALECNVRRYGGI